MRNAETEVKGRALPTSDSAFIVLHSAFASHFLPVTRFTYSTSFGSYGVPSGRNTSWNQTGGSAVDTTYKEAVISSGSTFTVSDF